MLTRSKRITAVLILAALAAASLGSCGETENVTETTVTDESVSTPAESTAELPPEPFDTKGYRFNALVGYVTYRPVDVDAISGDIINDELYSRNRRIEAAYNCVISSAYSDDIASDIRKNSMSGDDQITLAVADVYTAGGALALEGMLRDLCSVSSIDSERSWYDQNAIKELSVDGKLYLGFGDLDLSSNDNILCLAFNKKLMNDVIGEDIYSIVSAGEWTIDKFREMCEKVSDDLDGNGEMNWKDRYGLLGSSTNAHGLFYASGEKIVKKQSDGSLALTMYNDRSVRLVDKIYDFCFESPWFADATKIDITGATGDMWSVALGMFQSDKGLFRSSLIRDLISYRSMDTDFGILPYPKLDADQERYYTPLHVNLAAFMMPISVADPETAGALIEALSADSHENLLPLYYEKTLQGKVSRDNESSAMLDIIFGSKTYDLGSIYNVGGYQKLIINTAGAGKRTFASDYAAGESVAESDLADLVEKLGKIK